MKLRLVDTKKAVIYVLMLAMSLMSLPVQANSLVYDPFVRDATNRQNFEPGGKYHLFGSRGSTTDRKGKISVIPTASQNIGGLSLEQALIRGNITYNVKFSGHGHEVHGPFDNHASKSSSDKKGQALIGFTTYQLSWKGHEHHPADAYDGPQGSNFPAPTGARDEYSYGISGSAARVQVNFNDNRDTGQRFKDRVENAKNSVTEGTKDAWNKATTHNPELNRAGNAAEVVSAAAAGAGNFIGAGWELLGAGDVAQGASTLKDIAGMEALRTLPPEEQLKAVRAITGAADGYDAANAAYARWAQQNPNAAAVVGAAGSVAEQVVSRNGKSKDFETARQARDALANQKKRKHATYVGGEKDGVVVSGCSKDGKCAEDHIAEQLGQDQDVMMTEAKGWRRNKETGELEYKTIPVCHRCQTKYSREQFPEDVEYERGGAWDRE